MSNIDKLIHNKNGFISKKILIAGVLGAIILFGWFMIYTVIIPTESPRNKESKTVYVASSIIELLGGGHYRDRFGSLENIDEINKRFDEKIILKNNQNEKADMIVSIEEVEDNLFKVTVEWEEKDNDYSLKTFLAGG